MTGMKMIRTIFLLAAILVSGTSAATTISYLTEERYVEAFGLDYGYFSGGGRSDADAGADFDASESGFNCSNFCSGPGEWTAVSQATQQSNLAVDSLSVSTYASAGANDYSNTGAGANSIFDISFSVDQTTTFAVTGLRECSANLTGCSFTGNVLLETAGGDEIELDWQQPFTTPDQFVLDSTLVLAAGTYNLRVDSRYTVDCDPNNALGGCIDFGVGGSKSASFTMAALVPVPPALLLFPSALVALGWFRRR